MFKTMKKLRDGFNQKSCVDRPRQKRRMVLESLENRQMFAVVSTLGSDAILRVTGSESGERILVANQGPSTIVYDNGVAVFGGPSLAINQISIDARGGNDTAQVTNVPFYHTDPIIRALYNRVIPATIDGGSGNDTLIGSQANDVLRDSSGNNVFVAGDGQDTVYGGSGNDTIDGGLGDDKIYGYGGQNTIRGGSGADMLFGGDNVDILEGGDGNDSLYGYGGNDTIRGDSGDDTLYGDGGDDVLWGGAGADRLFGYGGNDRLFGDGGNDMLYGDSGNDGLFGGGGADTLNGGSGADRLLVWDAVFSDIAYHIVRDLESADAVIRFRDTTTNMSANGMNWASEIWTEDEIEQVDDSLNWLHRLTNNTSLLKTSTGGGIYFERWGANLEPAGGGVFAWNLGAGRMSITDVGFANGKSELDLSVIHEIAHNWDSENPLWSEFLALSGWRQQSSGTWVSNSTAQFYGGGSVNPFEDFAWSFEAFYLQNQGTLSSATATRMAAKLDLIGRFVQSMRTA